MPAWADNLASDLWSAGLSVIPLAVLIAVMCRISPLRPATRHSLWLLLLAWFVVPVVVPLPWLPDWPVAPTEPRDIEATTAANRPPRSAREAARSSNSPDTRIVPAAEVRSAPQSRLAAQRTVESAAEPRFPAVATATNPPPAARAPASVRGSSTDAVPPKSSIRTEPRHPGLLAPAAGSGGSPEQVTAPPSQTAELDESSAAQPVSNLSLPLDSPRWSASDAPVPLSAEVQRPAPAKRTTPVTKWTPDKAVAPKQNGRDAPEPHATSVAMPPDVSVMEPSTQPSWLSAMDAVRQAVIHLPPLPVWIWLVGVGAVGFGCALSTLRFAGCLRRARPAPREVRKEVAEAATAIGLRAAPEVYFVDARVSPLIWCGARPRLILPQQLWSELDAVGRSAVLYHELAHLRRRDHWVRWGELLICAAYWWHPLAWWVRRRISEEAENCCDAWVTWLLPHGRRAYAEALLHANEFVNRSQHAAAPMGLGVVSGRAKRMARRITMVMTHSTRPGLSGAGVTLACTLALIGWSTTPLWACPKKTRAATQAPTAMPTAVFTTNGATAPRPPTPPTPPTPLAPAAAPAAPCAAVTIGTTPAAIAPVPLVAAIEGRAALTPVATPRPLGVTLPALFASGGQSGQRRTPGRRVRAVAPRAIVVEGDDEHGGLELRLERLEAQLEALHEQLAELHGSLGGQVEGHGAAAADAALHREHALVETLAARAAGAAYRDAERAAVEAEGRAVGARGAIRRDAAREAVAAELRAAGAAASAPDSQSFRLPDGKLKALSELLIRDDVPVRVRPGNGEIEVLGSPEQQRAVERFIALLDGPTNWREYKLSEGKLVAFAELMTRDDVPIMVRPGDSSISIQATPSQHRAIEAFLKEIEPDMPAAREDESDAKSDGGARGDDDADADEEPTAAMPAEIDTPEPALGALAPGAWSADTPVADPIAARPTLLALAQRYSAPVEFSLPLVWGAYQGVAMSDPVGGNARSIAEQLKQQADALAAQADALHADRANVGEQLESLSTSIAQFTEQAELFSEKADSLEGRADDLTGAAREPAQASAATLRDQARGIEAQVRIMESQAAELERQAADAERQIDSLREAVEALRSTAEDLLERSPGQEVDR